MAKRNASTANGHKSFGERNALAMEQTAKRRECERGSEQSGSVCVCPRAPLERGVGGGV